MRGSSLTLEEREHFESANDKELNAWIIHKGVMNAVNWKHACALIQIVKPAVLSMLIASPDLRHDVPHNSPLKGGGYPTTTLRPTMRLR